MDDLLREQRIEFRHLRAFVTLAEELHFGRAASRLHLAQPALTKQIQQLERSLSVRLVDRTARGVLLTDVGRTFLVEAERTIEQARIAFNAAQRAERGELGTIRVGFAAAAPNGVFPHIVSAFRSHCPEVEVELHELWSGQQQQALLAERIDVGFGQRPAIESELLQLDEIQEDPVVVAVREDDPLASAGTVPLSALADRGFVMFPRRLAPAWYDELVSACVDAGFSPRAVQHVASIDATLGLVAAGLGVALLPASVQTIGRLGVSYAPLDEPTPVQRTMIARRKSDSSPVVARFVEISRSIAIIGAR